MESKLQQAIAAIKAGDKATGQRLLVDFLKGDQHNEAAWLWMAATFDDAEKRRRCLQTVLEINPDSEPAKRGLAQLEPQVELPSFEPLIPAPASIVATKDCPWCKAQIPMEAVACMHCGRDLPGSPAAKSSTMRDVGSLLTRVGCWILVLGIVIPILIILIGALTTK